MDNYSNPLWIKLVQTIAAECEVEEVSAESAASAVLAIPEIRDALLLVRETEQRANDEREDGYA